MFVEEKAVGEEQQQKRGTLKLSDAILKGLPIVGRDGRYSYTTCAMGCAFAGVHGRSMTHKEERAFVDNERSADAICARIGESLGFPKEAATLAGAMHLHDMMPAAKIAAKLAERGY